MKTCKHAITLAAAALALGIGGQAYATLIAYEGFATPGDYTDGSFINAQTGGGVGDWTGDYILGSGAGATNPSQLKTVTASMTYSTLLTTDGSATKNGATTTGNRMELYRSVTLGNLFPDDNNVNTGYLGEVWLSAIINRTAGGNGWYISISHTTSIGAQMGIGIGAANSVPAVQGGIQNNFGPTDAGTGPTAITNGTSYFVVARITNNVTSIISDVAQHNPIIDVWLNPDLTDDLSAVAVGGGDVTHTRFYQGIATWKDAAYLQIYSHQATLINMDEIRISTTYLDVIGIPEPGSLALMALSGLLMFRRTHPR